MIDQQPREDAAITTLSSRVPLTALVARHLILRCFEQKDQWTRLDLVRTVENCHTKEGGLPGKQPTVMVVKKALTELRAEGLVRPVSKGLWRYVTDAESLSNDTETEGETIGDPSNDDDQENGLEAEETVGAGDELIYMYYNPNDRRLAQLESRSTWECKIGCTTGEAGARIVGQGARTALSHTPVVALIIRTDDARTLESVFHRSLRLADSTVVDAGPEWFMTSPERIKAWYSAFMDALNHLKIDRANA